MWKHPSHAEQLVAIKKIEGQLRGVKKMIEEGRYCVDVLTQLHAAVGSILSVEDKILRKHISECIAKTLRYKSDVEKNQKIDELLRLLNKLRGRI